MSERVTTWVEGYLRAWESNEPDDIRALFTDDAQYLTAPFRPPWRGVDQIIEGWIDRRDEPGDATFTWSVLGETADRAFVQGRAEYRGRETYSNLWVIDFAGDGRASSFTEWWMENPA
jgi:ketosteroid isomerase-like protein